MQFLSATSDTQGIHYSIWLDTSKFAAGENEPDSNYVRSYNWGPCPSDWPGGTSAYQQMTLTEVKLLAQADLDAIIAPTPAPTEMSVHGQTF